jgi:fumarate reductase subunit D
VYTNKIGNLTKVTPLLMVLIRALHASRRLTKNCANLETYKVTVKNAVYGCASILTKPKG